MASKDLPDFEYTCSTGRHQIGGNKPLTKCPGYWKGSPCGGTLQRVGKGSRNNGGTTNDE